MTSFVELRTGMIVVIKGCDRCRGQCRGMLTNPYSERDEPAWLIEPSCQQGRRQCVGKYSVDQGRVFRVIDGLEDSSTNSASRRTKLGART